MYTGIIEEVGRIVECEQSAGGCRLRIAAETGDLEPDESIGVSGVCLTAEAVGEGWFRAFCSRETVERTYLAQLQAGDSINIERPVAVDGQFGGHVVKGTVDTTTEVVSIEGRRGATRRFTIALPSAYERYITERGSVALDGVSLTVAGVTETTFGVTVIPATDRHTTLAEKRAGDPVHFEADLLSKYAERRGTSRRGPAAN